MPLYLSIGDELLSQDEIVDKSASKELEQIIAGTKKVQLYGGFPTGDKREFRPVGPGKPMSIEIREIFTGELPKPAWYSLDDKKDLLVTTSHKPITQSAAACRAVNMVRQEVAQNSSIKDVAAIEVGTPIIYYSPAIVDTSLSVTVEFGFENFSKQALNTLSAAFQTAATIPIFATKSMYLLAAGMVTKLIAELGKAIFEKGPEFVGTDSINFDRPGIGDTAAGYGVLFSADAPPSIQKAYNVNEDGVLVHKQTAKQYEEKYPYAILSIDGTEKNASYENFQQSAASAELLARFYNVGENRTEPVDELLKGLRYYNDMKFRHEAVKLEREIDNYKDKGDAEGLRKLKEKHKALLANILTDELKP